jgi:uncharacterized membrane protein YadS
MNGRGVHRSGTLLLSIAMVAIGIGLLVQSLDGHAASITPRLLLGMLFIAAGSGRLYLLIRGRREG